MKKTIEQAKALLKAIQENPQGMEELNKAFNPNIKGVHQSAFMHSDKSGTSSVGAHMAPGGVSPQTNAYAKVQHLKILAEQKAMKKPILGKEEDEVSMPKKDFIKEHKNLVHTLKTPSHKDDLAEAKEQGKELKEEMSKAKLEEGAPADYKQDIRAARQAPRPTVNPTIHQPFDQNIGRSQAGSATAGAHKAAMTGIGGAGTKEALLAKAKQLHQKVLSGMQSQKAPNLPKSELEKAKIDQGLSIPAKNQARWDRGGVHQDQSKGVHTAPFKSVPGMSVSGHEISQTGTVTPIAKESHIHKVKELKAMLAPKLGKGSAMPAPAPAPMSSGFGKILPKPKPKPMSAPAPMMAKEEKCTTCGKAGCKCTPAIKKDETSAANGEIGTKKPKEFDPLKDAPELKEINPAAYFAKKKNKKK
jgi:hypothetical protein